MPEAEVIELYKGFSKEGSWAVHWKKHGTSEIRDCILSFGFSRSWEEAVAKVHRKIKADPMWAEKFVDGVFYPVLVSAAVKVPKPGGKEYF